MAQGKKSFVLYCDQKELFDQLTDEQAGKLIKHIFAYVNDENPATNDVLLNLAFTPIKQSLKRDLKRYENIVERNRENGKKGGRPRKPKKPNGLIQNPEEPKKADSDNDSDNDIDIINKDKLIVFFELLQNHFNETFNKRTRVFPPSIKKKYKQALKEGYNIEDIKQAMINASKDNFHIESNFKYCTLEFFSRIEKIDKFSTTKETKYIPTR